MPAVFEPKGIALEKAAPAIDSGDTAWMIVATARLVLTQWLALTALVFGINALLDERANGNGVSLGLSGVEPGRAHSVSFPAL